MSSEDEEEFQIESDSDSYNKKIPPVTRSSNRDRTLITPRRHTVKRNLNYNTSQQSEDDDEDEEYTYTEDDEEYVPTHKHTNSDSSEQGSDSGSEMEKITAANTPTTRSAARKRITNTNRNKKHVTRSAKRTDKSKSSNANPGLSEIDTGEEYSSIDSDEVLVAAVAKRKRKSRELTNGNLSTSSTDMRTPTRNRRVRNKASSSATSSAHRRSARAARATQSKLKQYDKLRLVHSTKCSPIQPIRSSSSEGSSSENSEEGDEGYQPRFRRLARPAKRVLNTTPKCNTELDSVTSHAIESKHLCWNSPDSSVKLCYNYSTLRDIAVINGHGNWLEPPHFRSPMSESIKAEMSKLFGANSMDLQNGAMTQQDELGFNTMLNDYGVGLMQEEFKGDMYICPICHEMMYNDVTHAERSVSGDLEEEQDSPMKLLTSLPHDKVVQACFIHANKLKDHLFFIHGVVVSTEQNSVLDRYHIRSQDGLLHQWLYQTGYKSSYKSKLYWRMYSLDFIHLRSQALTHEERVDRSSNHDGFTLYSESRLTRESKKIWKRIASALSSERTSDDENFIASDDGESSEAVEDHQRLDREIHEAEEDFDLAEMIKKVKRLEQRTGELSEEYDEEDSSSGVEVVSDSHVVLNVDSSSDESDVQQTPRKKRLKLLSTLSSEDDD